MTGDLCPVCQCPQPDYSHLPDFAVPVRPAGVLHRPDCPTLPQLGDEEKRELAEALAAIHRAQDWVAEAAHHYVIHGGGPGDR